MDSVTIRVAAGVLLGLLIGLPVREMAKARIAVRLGDLTPARFGRIGVKDPRSWVDPVGTVMIPGLATIVALFGAFPVVLPFAYAKPMPLDPMMLRRARNGVWIFLAGPIANLVLAMVVGLALRFPGLPPTVQVIGVMVLVVNLVMAVVHLLPIPGLDGAHILVRFLPPKPAQAYRSMEQYMVLFILGIFFLLGGLLNALVLILVRGICDLISLVCGV